jgi:hypothetical protein
MARGLDKRFFCLVWLFVVQAWSNNGQGLVEPWCEENRSLWDKPSINTTQIEETPASLIGLCPFGSEHHELRQARFSIFH